MARRGAARTVRCMVDQRLRVDVGVEPFVLRSALGACLEQDPRLDVAVLPPNCVDDTVGSIVLPGRRRVSDATVTAVEDCPPRVQVWYRGTGQTMPYDGMERFAEGLFNAVSVTMSDSSLAARNEGAR